MIKKLIVTGAAIISIPVLVGLGFASSQYADFPGFNDDNQDGRTKNSIATILTGLVGQRMYDGNSAIDVEVKKTFFPDSQITGYTTPQQIETHTSLTFTSSHFSARKNAVGLLEGKVEKSEFDWAVEQTGPETYRVQRFGPKFNTTLDLKIKNGTISGTYKRPAGFDWSIDGVYDSQGNVTIDVHVPLGLGLSIEGKITK